MQRRISEHRTMPRRKHESVAIGPFRIARIELQIVGIKHGGDVGHAHRHPGMAAVRGLYGVHRKRADRVGELTFGQCHMSPGKGRSEEHTSELQSLMRSSYAVFCLKKKKK